MTRIDPPLPPARSDGSPALQVEDLVYRYRGRLILDGVGFEVAAGECVGLAGINGAGKTTLLRCLLDFTRPERGTIRLFGIDSRRPEARARIGFLPERFAPPAALTGHEVLQWLAGLHGSGWSRDDSARAFERFEIAADALRRPVGQFSKGMTQKLGLAAVLSSGRSLVILDEPMSGLDPIARRFVARALSQARSAGTTLLFTSHSPADIERLCDRLLVMHEGRQCFAGAPDQLRAARPAQDLEQAFVDLIGAQPTGVPT